MPEQYLTVNDVAKILQVSKRTVQRRMPAMRAKGLKVVKVGHFPRIIESSLDKVLLKAAAREEPLV